MKQGTVLLLLLLAAMFANATPGYQILTAEKGTELRRIGDEILVIKQIQTDTVYCQDDIRKMCQMRTSFDQLVQRVNAPQGMAPDPMIYKAILSKSDVLVRQTEVENHSDETFSWMGLCGTYPLYQTYVSYNPEQQKIQLKQHSSQTDVSWNVIGCFTIAYLVFIFMFWLLAANDLRYFWKNLENATLMGTGLGALGLVTMIGLYLLAVWCSWVDVGSQVFASTGSFIIFFIACIIFTSGGKSPVSTPQFIEYLPRKTKQQLLLVFLGLSLAAAVGIFAIQSSWGYGIFWASVFVGLWLAIRTFFAFLEYLERGSLKLSQ